MKPKSARWWKKIVDNNVYLSTRHLQQAFEANDLLPLNDAQLHWVLTFMKGATTGVLGAVTANVKRGDDLSGIDKAYAPRHEWKRQKEYVSTAGAAPILKNVWVCQRCMMWTSNVKQYKNEPCKVHTGP